jgi:hypothetical protein
MHFDYTCPALRQAVLVGDAAVHIDSWTQPLIRGTCALNRPERGLGPLETEGPFPEPSEVIPLLTRPPEVAEVAEAVAEAAVAAEAEAEAHT